MTRASTWGVCLLGVLVLTPRVASSTEPAKVPGKAAQPVAAQPVAAKSVAAKPVAANSVAAKPGTTPPVANPFLAKRPVPKPVAAKPVAAKPVAAKPVAAKPVAAKPKAVKVAAAGAAHSDRSPAAKLFGKKCGACHTLGEGDRVGPDLVGATKRRERPWLEKFILNPGAVIDAGDPVAKQLLVKYKGVRMPEQQLTPDQLGSLLGYIESCTAKGGCKLAMGDVRHANAATADEIETGKRLFLGKLEFSKQGAACVSCHHVRGLGLLGGGTLAMDLTHVYARLGDAGLSAALDNTPFPFMKDLYAKRPLTEDEAFQVKSFLASVAKSGDRSRKDFNFFYLGVLGMLLCLGIIGFLWKGRMRGVRSTIVKRGES